MVSSVRCESMRVLRLSDLSELWDQLVLAGIHWLPVVRLMTGILYQNYEVEVTNLWCIKGADEPRPIKRRFFKLGGREERGVGGREEGREEGERGTRRSFLMKQREKR